MAKLLLPIFLILTVCAIVSAQDNKAQNCPSIKITEPDQRDIFLATAKLSVEMSENPEPTGFEWQINRGIITSGLDSRTVHISFSREDNLQTAVAEVRIKGLPPGCHDRATIRFEVVVDPGSPLILDEFGDLDISDVKARLQAAASDLEKHPDSHLVFVVRNETPGKSPFANFLASLEGHLTAELALNRDQFKIVNAKGSQPYVTIYLHPNDAEPIFVPEDTAGRSQCPTITVTGPAGIPVPGEVLTFRATYEGSKARDVSFKWTITEGTIVEGQGTLNLKVRPPDEPYSLTATFEVAGLDKKCPNRASEYAEVIGEPEPVLLDEFSSSVAEIREDALRTAVRDLQRNPTNQLYIIEYFPPGTSEFSIREKLERIKRFMADELDFDVSAVTIVTAEADRPRTKIYRVPPGGENPIP